MLSSERSAWHVDHCMTCTWCFPRKGQRDMQTTLSHARDALLGKVFVTCRPLYHMHKMLSSERSSCHADHIITCTWCFPRKGLRGMYFTHVSTSCTEDPRHAGTVFIASRLVRWKMRIVEIHRILSAHYHSFPFARWGAQFTSISVSFRLCGEVDNLSEVCLCQRVGPIMIGNLILCIITSLLQSGTTDAEIRSLCWESRTVNRNK